MTTEQPEALRLADTLDLLAMDMKTPRMAAAELRRLHAEIEALRAGYDAARLELEAIGAGGVEPLRKRCLHQISEPAQPVAWAIFAEDGGACMWTQIRQHAEATAKDIGLQVTPLYAAPQPAAPRNATLYDPDDVAFPAPRSADEGDALPTELASIAKQASTAAAEVAAPQPAAPALDAARYQFLRDGEWRDTELESFIRLQLNTLWDSKIDAAIAAKKGGKP